MPYSQGTRLPGEQASKLGHLQVLQSTLVQKLVQLFEVPGVEQRSNGASWGVVPSLGQPLDLIFGVDGSLQIIEDKVPPHKALAFVKTAVMSLDQTAIAQLDKESPHPFAIRDLMAASARYHATALPLRHIRVPDVSLYDAIRGIIFDSVRDASLDSEPMETLKWLAYEKWSGGNKSLPEFQCPVCASEYATLPYGAETGPCPSCGAELYITDMLGFHLDMVEEAAADSVATAYMNIHETLLLFTGIRYFWETNPNILRRCLFLKDGPLQIRAQYSKLVNPIRRFLWHAHQQGISICIAGQEKTGAFCEHLELIGREVPPGHYFIPGHLYICEEIQHRPAGGAPYGKDTNYGVKVFLVLDDRYRFVLNIPVDVSMDHFIRNPTSGHLIGFDRIMATLPSILSTRYENALLPVELAHAVASLSTYPSGHVLKLFADSAMRGHAQAVE